MQERYEDSRITNIWSNEQLLLGWQTVEKALIQARFNLKLMPEVDFRAIMEALDSTPPEVDCWKDWDNRLHHDLNAALKERMRFIPNDLQRWYHSGITSYDAEEAAMLRKIIMAIEIYEAEVVGLLEVIKSQAFKYRYTPMMGVTHGQWADPQSFGKRLACWYQELQMGLTLLRGLKLKLIYSKMSGFVGNYTGITPEIEKETLRILGFKPYYGATQIVPRTLYVPVASTIGMISKTIANIAMTIRLGARSASVLYHEPFGKQQTGSTAGPHKRNTINDEKAGGMDIMITKYTEMIIACCATWEERDIAHSSVERNAWPDLFHASIHQAKVMTKMIGDLVVYPKNMMLEIVKTNGCYAANVAKEQLKEWGESYGLSAADCYKIFQLAAFNLSCPIQDEDIGNDPDLMDVKFFYAEREDCSGHSRRNIKSHIALGELEASSVLDIPPDTIKDWNKKLRAIFDSVKVNERWDEVFSLKYLLRNEDVIFEEVFPEPEANEAYVPGA